jgi:methyl-accepting chemotaxis protein
MSRKTKRHQSNSNMENRSSQMPSGTDIANTAKETLDSVVGTVNNNKLLIGSIAGACGAAIFLLVTESGKRIRTGIQEQAVDLYDYVSEQVSNGVERVRELSEKMLSESEGEEASSRTKRVA